MTHEPRNPDHDLRDLFRRARRAETTRAPAFRALVHEPARRRRIPRPLRVALAASIALAVVAIAAFGAVRLWSPRSEPVQVAQAFTTAPQARPTIVSKAMPPPPPEAQKPPVSAPSPGAVRARSHEVSTDAEPAPAEHPTEEASGKARTADEVRAAYQAELARRKELYEESLRARPEPASLDSVVVTGVSNVDPNSNEGVKRVSAAKPQAMISPREAVLEANAMQFLRARGDAAEGWVPDSAEPYNAEGYAAVDENDFLAVKENPLSTFSIDVDTASYANVRRFLDSGRLPPSDAVRIEELVNYFAYDYPAPTDGAPFAASVEVADCPWKAGHRLARIGIKGREIARGESVGSNLVFLIDVSGSMDEPSKLPLLKSALGLLVEELTSRDQVAIVVYAGSSGLVLPPTSGDAKADILDALDRLEAGGSTNGGAGLRLAYKTAREGFIPGGINRVILATDGDFNIGVTSHGELLKLIKQDADDGIFLTTLGFGFGNYQDDRLEQLADKGNGNHAYIDNLKEARKVLVEQLTGTLMTIAKDVKIQVEFNPLEVGAYRLIGYENRMLKKEDFNDDRKDAGEIGAGHTVTALYELVPPGREGETARVDPLRYQAGAAPSEAASSGELFTLKMRYKEPEGDTSLLTSIPVVDAGIGLEAASGDYKFAAAVAEFGMLLRDSAHKGEASFESVEKLALAGSGADEKGYRAEFLELVREAEALEATKSRN